MAYPDTIDSFPTRETDDYIPPADYNGQNSSIVAIETELGTLPKGSKADVKTRLNDVDSAIDGKVSKAGDTMSGDLEVETKVLPNIVQARSGSFISFRDSAGTEIFRIVSNKLYVMKELQTTGVQSNFNAGVNFLSTIKVDNTSGASGSFTTVDGKTVTVVRGIITNIV